MPPTPINNVQPSLALTRYIVAQGLFPAIGDGFGLDAQPNAALLGAVHTFAGGFAPGQGLLLQGQTLPIGQNTALFATLGDTYGGQPGVSFALPDLGGRLAVNEGAAPGLAQRPLGAAYGSETVALGQPNLAAGSGGVSAPVENAQPTLPIRFGIVAAGSFPTPGGMDLASVGVVQAFANARLPAGYVEADGRLLEIDSYNALFALIGTRFGGDGVTTFAVPDLRGRAIVGATDGFPPGTVVGAETVSVGQPNMPLNMGGAGQPLDHRQPSIALNTLIATQGLFASRDGGAQDFSTPFVGQVVATLLDGFVPSGWARTDGCLLPVISQNAPLFASIGFAYGGNGTTTFALPDLRGRAIVGTGGEVQLGARFGEATVAIDSADVPALLIPGTPANDRYWGGDQADSISGAGGDDRLLGNAGDDALRGDGGNDVLLGGPGDDLIDGGPGADQMQGNSGSDVFVADVPEDQATDAGAPGGGEVDQLWSSASAFDLGAGIEIGRLFGAGLVLRGGTSTTDLVANPDLASTLVGGAGNETLWALGPHAHTLQGGGGNDILRGAGGPATLEGGAGNDLYAVASVGTVVVEAAAGGGDADAAFVSAAGWTAAAGLEAVYLVGGAMLLVGSDGADTLVANATLGSQLLGLDGDDALWGQAGGDALVGGGGRDVLRGGGGNDQLTGGEDDDQLVGGAGADVFLHGDGPWGYDQIFDFSRAEGDVLAFVARPGLSSLADFVVYAAAGNTALIAPDGSRVDLYGVSALTDADIVFA